MSRPNPLDVGTSEMVVSNAQPAASDRVHTYVPAGNALAADPEPTKVSPAVVMPVHDEAKGAVPPVGLPNTAPVPPSHAGMSASPRNWSGAGRSTCT